MGVAGLLLTRLVSLLLSDFAVFKVLHINVLNVLKPQSHTITQTDRGSIR